jgi:gamma-D-glutamyl-L-lysine dipeptidyl-peptidase
MAAAVAVAAGSIGVAATHAAPAPVRPAASDAAAHASAHRPATHRSHPSHAAARPAPAWVKAHVATVWKHPREVRPVDRPAIAARPDIRRWLSHQTVAARVQLAGRVLTQAVRGERLVVLRHGSGWTKVRVLDQRGSLFRHGIPGWVPTRQLSTRQLTAHALQPSVRRPTAAGEMRVARGFLGTPYLWGGMSRAGIDCSGLTYRVFRAVGVVLPRDAADQSRHGRVVPRAHLRAGDLVFFGPGGRPTIHHVGIYAGHGLVLHAPHTGARVQITPLRAWSDYWGARRILHAG